MKVINFVTIYKKYAGEWIALASNEKKVVGASSLAKLALHAAKKAGEKKPILFKVPSPSISWVGGG